MKIIKLTLLLPLVLLSALLVHAEPETTAEPGTPAVSADTPNKCTLSQSSASQAPCCKRAAEAGRTCGRKCCIKAAREGHPCEKCLKREPRQRAKKSGARLIKSQPPKSEPAMDEEQDAPEAKGSGQ